MNAASRRLAELQVAFMLMTRLPAGRVGDPVPTIAEACWAFPLCGAAIGMVTWLGFAGSGLLGLPASVAALVAIAVGLLATGALHEDGLADVADGFGGGRDPQSKLRIMRDSRIGSYGVLALAIAMGLKASCLAELGHEAAGAAAFAAMGAGSRCCILAAVRHMPAARSDGLGRAVGGGGSGRRLAVGVAVSAALLAPFGLWGALLAAAMSLAAGAPAILAQRQIGGQTGDVLGAVQVVSETAGWMALLAISGANLRIATL